MGYFSQTITKLVSWNHFVLIQLRTTQENGNTESECGFNLSK